MKKIVVFTLICFVGLSLNADLLIGDAGFVTLSPSEDVLITLNFDGGLGILITDEGAGNYDFSAALAGTPYRLYSVDSLLEFDPFYANTYSPLVPSFSGSLQTFLPGQTKCYAELTNLG